MITTIFFQPTLICAITLTFLFIHMIRTQDSRLKIRHLAQSEAGLETSMTLVGQADLANMMIMIATGGHLGFQMS